MVIIIIILKLGWKCDLWESKPKIKARAKINTETYVMDLSVVKTMLIPF